ncbi:hypothetical protein [Sphingomonas sp. Leaf10]|uniref:hypothetical protein n=1 Tax=Sphingomonas sp. Leaf10 TaxID=1735676 RepID=UPI0006F58323|nr:hypothetical protein [Sphingomonas sp. Leaf10]KQM35876.1 hypothetical protein ASE59_17780 [Sphingomonas sp. Leaf10]
MNGTTIADAATPRSRFAALRPLKVDDRAVRAASIVASLVVMALVGWQLSHVGVDRLWAMLPATPLFALLLVLLYLVLPVSEWLIYRRLWSAPLAILMPLVRKGVINDLVVSYGGEAFLYAWARARLKPGQAPFGTIKDVAILSALTANGVTLVLLLFALPWLRELVPPSLVWPILVSTLALLILPLVARLFAARIFNLPAADLRFVTIVHVGRIVTTLVLSSLLWASALPAVPVMFWIMLQSLRMLTSRLPLVPNKDVLFASIAILLVGHDTDVAALISLVATLTLALHLLVFAVLLLVDLVQSQRSATPARAGKEVN